MHKGKRHRLPARPPAFPLRALLARRGVSKQRLSDSTGIPYAVVCRLEKRTANPTWATIQRIARALKLSLGDLDGRAAQ